MKTVAAISFLAAVSFLAAACQTTTPPPPAPEVTIPVSSAAPEEDVDDDEPTTSARRPDRETQDLLRKLREAEDEAEQNPPKPSPNGCAPSDPLCTP